MMAWLGSALLCSALYVCGTVGGVFFVTVIVVIVFIAEDGVDGEDCSAVGIHGLQV